MCSPDQRESISRPEARDYSNLRATLGSTLAAFAAGTHAARRLVPKRMAATEISIASCFFPVEGALKEGEWLFGRHSRRTLYCFT
jgi:hypothetical protein